MKFDRRNFLSVIVGGTAGIGAGTALSPLPWKLTDDLAIWSQNWPWTPVPKTGAESYAHSTCSLCQGGCGISVRKIDNRAVKIEGMASHPVNDGGICILGLTGLQMLYGPTRVKTPMKRMGKRGEGKWQKISWEAAIAEITQRLAALRSKGNAHTLAALTGPGCGTIPKMLERFLLAFGSPNFIQTPTMYDTYEQALYHMHGGQNLVGFDLERSGFVLSFGSGLIEGWGSPVRMFRANSEWKKKGVPLIQVEPRLSNTAAKANEWVAINPGTESDLAFGMVGVILEKGLENKDFTKKYTQGLNAFKKFLAAQYAIEKVSETTGVEASVIVSLAERFSQADKPIAVCGRGKGESSALSMKEVMATHALNAIVGSIQREGGVLALPDYNYIQWEEPEFDSLASAGIQNGRLDGAGSDAYPTSKNLLQNFISGLSQKDPYGIDTLFIHQSNPLYTMADAAATKAAFDAIPFIVNFSSFMDESAKEADLILPEHLYLERYEDVPVVAGLSKRFVGLSKPVVSPQFNTRHMGDMIIAMAKGLEGSVAQAFPWSDYRACLKTALGSNWNGMVKKGFWKDSDTKPLAFKHIFKGPSGKFDFTGRLIDPVMSSESIQPSGDAGKLPFVLVSYDSVRLTSGYIGNPPFMIKTVSDKVLKGKMSLVEINPETAKLKGFKEGSKAMLSTIKGKFEVRIHLSGGIKPGVIALPKGLGHTAYDAYLNDKGVNTNELIPPVKDPVSGHNAAWGTRANLTKV